MASIVARRPRFLRGALRDDAVALPLIALGDAV